MTPDDDSKSTTEEGSNSISQSFERDLKNSSLEPVENEISQEKGRRYTIIISETNWKVVRLTALVIFIYRVQYTVNSGSLHPMLKTMDPALNQTFYGYITSIYNVGVAISAPTFGILANKGSNHENMCNASLFSNASQMQDCLFSDCKFKNSAMSKFESNKIIISIFGFRLPVLVTSVIMLLMNSGYIFLWNIPDNRRYYALIIRFFVGIAAGGSSILQFYWVTVTAKNDLSTAASYSDGAMSLGLAFGPVIQILTKYVGHPGTLLFGFLNISMFTIPAMIAIILVLIASYVLLLCFPKVDTKSTTVYKIFISKICEKLGNNNIPVFFDSNADVSDTDEVNEKNTEDIPLNYFLIFLCFGFRSVQNIIFANVETNNNQFIMWMFNYTKQESSIVGSALCSMSGLLGFLFLVCYVWTGTSKRVANLLGVFIGFVACLIFLLGSFPYPSYNDFIISSYCNATWCSETPTISFPLFVAVYLLIFSVGFPLLSVHTSALLSKTLGGRKQAHIHGMANFVSTVARVAAGPLMGHALEAEGIEVTWFLQIGLLILTIFIIVVYSRIESIIQFVKFMYRKISRKVGPRKEETNEKNNFEEYKISIRRSKTEGI